MTSRERRRVGGKRFGAYPAGALEQRRERRQVRGGKQLAVRGSRFALLGLPRRSSGATLARAKVNPRLLRAVTCRTLAGMSLLERITIDPHVRFGKPCVRGTRMTVGDVLGYLAGGMTEAELFEDFPQLTHDDVRACLAYAAERERRTLSIPAA